MCRAGLCTKLTCLVCVCLWLAGWRLGYMAAPRHFVKPAALIQSQSTSCASSIAQHAGLAALSMGRQGGEVVAKMVSAFEERKVGLDRPAQLMVVRGNNCHWTGDYMVPAAAAAADPAPITYSQDMIVKKLRAIPGVKLVEPQGAFYVLPEMSAFFGPGAEAKDFGAVPDSDAFCMYLMHKAHVSV